MKLQPSRGLPDAEKILVLILEHESALGDDRLLGLLDWSPDELERMGRFKHQGAKTSWCLSRRLLRDALSELCGIRDATRRLEYGEFGKPFIGGCDMRFNWSHAEGCIALALTQCGEIGIDIEGAWRHRGDYLDIARDYFLESEREWIGSELGTASWERFLSLFVQKEAWLKATGTGLSASLAEAPAALELPPSRSPGRVLAEVGRVGRYFLAVDASLGEGGNMPGFRLEYE